MLFFKCFIGCLAIYMYIFLHIYILLNMLTNQPINQSENVLSAKQLLYLLKIAKLKITEWRPFLI